MFLKSLQIKGFKSFAESTILELEPGVTVVVGPNGSGKSNVVDAIGWVLGAQAPSAVRSSKMDDVIFAGTSKRAALGRAEVGLTIDNSAGLLPLDFAEITITRRLFRSGDSEYEINGTPCRLLDIQELLSDTGVGRQQHVIISQGNIDAVLNAKPEDRRTIIEEAAGVLKFRRRKERAERRLSSTEANLTRLQDLLREVRRQLRPLERQADAARRHADVLAEVRALRLHLAGRELSRLRSQLDEGTRRQHELRGDDQRLRARLADLDAQVMNTEAELTALGGDDFGDALVRYEALRERARGLAALLAERARGVERDMAGFVDEAVVASLESEHAELTRELAEVTGESDRLAVDAAVLVEAETALAALRAEFEGEWGTGPIAPTGEAAEVRGELAALRASMERTLTDRDRLDARSGALADRAQRITEESARLTAELEAARADIEPGIERVRTAHEARAAAQAALSELESQTQRELASLEESTQTETTRAEEALQAAEAEASTWTARAEALALALDAARARAGAERLSDVQGVLGTLLDLIDVDPGWEQAFEAAAGEALAAVVVESPHVGREALVSLVEAGQGGAVLALGTGATPPPVPPVGESVRKHVRARHPDLDGVLDVLVGGAVAVEGAWTAALDAALAHPSAVVVTREGDRFGVAGWRLGVAQAGATGAALEEAVLEAERAVAARDEARGVLLALRDRTRTAVSGLREQHRERLAAARAELERTRNEEAAGERANDATENRVRALTDALHRAQRERAESTSEHETVQSHLQELTDRLAAQQSREADLAGRLPALEAAEAELNEKTRRMQEAREALDQRGAEVGSLRTDLEVRSAGLDERRRYVTDRLAQVDERLGRYAAERAAAVEKRIVLEARAEVTGRLSRFVAARLEHIESELALIRDARRRQSEETRGVTLRLDGLRRDRQAAEKQLEEARTRLQQTELQLQEIRLRIEGATETLRTELDVEPQVAIDAPVPELPEGVPARQRLTELERELRLMGPINPLALQEFEALKERHEFLEGQLEDVRQTRRELGKVIRAVDEEIIRVFASAYADVAANFESLFGMLFPGGTGRLRLTSPDDLLSTGIEIEAKPSGKNVRKLSLLSGGERSLTALAYLFSVFRSRPSPFYVMDEVEAALDDVNLHRFLELVAEFRSSAQLIIVSHQKRTMEAADVLYGVTMEPGGSSRVVSEKAASVLD